MCERANRWKINDQKRYSLSIKLADWKFELFIGHFKRDILCTVRI